MLKHTMASVGIIKDELSFFSFIANVISSLFMVGYLVFASFVGRGVLWINISLCGLTAINFVTYLATRKKNSNESKSVRKFVKHFYRVSRIVLNAIPIGTVLYLLAFTNEEINRVELVFLPLLILVWLAQVVLEISTLYVESRFTLFVDGLKMDMEPILKIKNAILGNNDKEVDLNVSKGHRDMLAEEAERRAEYKESEEESDSKDGIVKRFTNTVSAIKEYIKK